jgi:hypothetical protein
MSRFRRHFVDAGVAGGRQRRGCNGSFHIIGSGSIGIEGAANLLLTTNAA